MNAFYKLISANRERTYCVSLAPGLSVGNVGELIPIIDGRKCLLITTPTVSRLYANQIASSLIRAAVDLKIVVLRCTEQTKSFAEVERLCQKCFETGMDRRSLLIGLGGGVCTDLVTLAASLTRRGLSYLRIPTTLIGLIDAGVGVKGAVNLPNKKSAIGVFSPPDHVLLDPSFVQTLPRELVSDGLAEAIKVGVTLDPFLFEILEQFSNELLKSPSTADIVKLTKLVWRSSLRLLEELEKNLYEDRGYERVLDFGHTFSPLLESMSGFQVSHGVAVAIDIALSSALAHELGLLSIEDRNRILRSLRTAGLPISSPILTDEVCHRALREMEAHRGGHLNLVVPSGIGKSVFINNRQDLPTSALRAALRFLDRESPSVSMLHTAVSALGHAGPPD